MSTRIDDTVGAQLRHLDALVEIGYDIEIKCLGCHNSWQVHIQFGVPMSGEDDRWHCFGEGEHVELIVAIQDALDELEKNTEECLARNPQQFRRGKERLNLVH